MAAVCLHFAWSSAYSKAHLYYHDELEGKLLSLKQTKAKSETGELRRE